MEKIGRLTVTVVCLFFSLVINGFVLSCFWHWFFVPFGLPPIGVAHALGLSLVSHYLSTSPLAAEKPPEEKIAEKCARLLFARIGFATVSLFIGFVVSRFMP